MARIAKVANLERCRKNAENTPENCDSQWIKRRCAGACTQPLESRCTGASLHVKLPGAVICRPNHQCSTEESSFSVEGSSFMYELTISAGPSPILRVYTHF